MDDTDRTTRSTSGDEDRLEGAGDKLKGRIKEAGGALSGDGDLKAEGRGDQMKGTVKEKKGLLKKLFS